MNHRVTPWLVAEVPDADGLSVFQGNARWDGPSQAGKDLMACQPNITIIIRRNSEAISDHGDSAPYLWRQRWSAITADLALRKPIAVGLCGRWPVDKEECQDEARADDV